MSGRSRLAQALDESGSEESFRSASTDPSEPVPQRQSPRKGNRNTANSPRRQQASQATTSKNTKPASSQKGGKGKAAATARQPNASPTRANPQGRPNPQVRTKSPARKNPPSKQNIPKPVVKATGAARRKQKAPALREIQRLQTNTACQIPKAPFGRLVREILQRNEPRGTQLRMTSQSLEALRESTEVYVTQCFTDSYHITLNRKQVTLQPRDLQLLMFLRGPSAGGPASSH